MEIQFIPTTKDSLLEPIPAIKQLPQWYKELSPYTHGKKDRFEVDGSVNETIKRCNPVGDAFNTGYFILLENDIYVTKSDDTESKDTKIHWLRGGKDFISTHHENQISSDIVPSGFSPKAFKFTNFFGLKTPSGYSTLFTHPLNRTELPFYTLQGVVDTDSYHTPVNFSFFIRNDFDGIIKAGTPIVQVIPFKREKWTSFISAPNLEMHNNNTESHKRSPVRWYKDNYWNKKEYK